MKITRMRPALPWLVCGLFACGKASDPNEGKRMPKPPPADVPIPDGISIAVEVDGAPGKPIDSDQLNLTKPDFADEERRAWRIETLLGQAAERDGVQISATGGKGVTILLDRPKAPGDPVPVLVVSRRGDVVAALVDAKEPFPAYHGRGGRLGRPGDPLPRVAQVTRIRVARRGPDDKRPIAEPEALEVVVAGRAPVQWTAAMLAEVPQLSVQAEGGNVRDAWSLREVTEKLAGKGARVTALSGEGARVLAIDEATWNDAARTPVLRRNRQGQFKLQWVEKGAVVVAAPERELRHVRRLELMVP